MKTKTKKVRVIFVTQKAKLPDDYVNYRKIGMAPTGTNDAKAFEWAMGAMRQVQNVK